MYHSSPIRALVGIAGAAILVVGCAGATDDEVGSDDIASAPIEKTVCFAGRTFGDVMSSGGIEEIDGLCRRMPNLIRDVPGGRDAPYNFFQWDSSLAHEMDVVVAALDTNHDGIVSGADQNVSLDVVGYSWGGFNALDFINAVNGDRRFAPERKTIHRYFALDAFRTDLLVIPRPWLDVPANVKQFWSFRHSVAPANDCSIILGGLLGPFTGRTPYCTGSTECHDYDFSKAEATKSVDHCDVPEAANAFVVGLTLNQPVSGLPPELRVARY